MRYGMLTLVDLLHRGHVPAGPDLEITVDGATISKGGVRFATLEAGGARVIPS